MFKVTLDTAELERAIRVLEQEWERGLSKVAENAAKDGIAYAKSQHPYTDRTGDLTGSLHVEPGVSALEFEMVAGTEYASYVEQGTSRSKPYPYLDPASEHAAVVLEQEFETLVHTIQNKLT